MHTRFVGQDERSVRVMSPIGDVQVSVDSEADGLPDGPLSRSEVHDALLKAKAKAEHFIAAVEGDIEATEAG